MTATKQKNETIHLIEMLLTNICHDMAGSIGATSNAAELLSNKNVPDVEKLQQQALTLIQNSAYEGVQRIKIFRKAYSAGDNYAEVNLYDYCSDLMETLTNKKINFILPADAKQRYYKAYIAKVTINMMLFLSNIISGKDTMKLNIKKHNEESITVNVTCTSHNNIKIDQNIVDVLLGKKELINTETVQAAFLYLLSQRYDCEIRISVGEKAIDVSAIFGQGHYS